MMALVVKKIILKKTLCEDSACYSKVSGFWMKTEHLKAGR
jgi:hypothetical protein